MKSFKKYLEDKQISEITISTREWTDNLKFVKRIFRDYFKDKINPWERPEYHNLIIRAITTLNHPKLKSHIQELNRRRPTYHDMEVIKDLGETPTLEKLHKHGAGFEWTETPAQGHVEKKFYNYYWKMHHIWDWLVSPELKAPDLWMKPEPLNKPRSTPIPTQDL